MAAGDELVSVIRQISIREFGSDNATQLFVLEDFNMTHLMSSKKEAGALRYYTLPNLKSGSSYVVCFETIHTSNNENNLNQNNNNEKEPKNSEDCHETRTLSAVKADMSSLINFPMTEVLISAAVTALICIFLAVMCCFLVKLSRKSSNNNNKNSSQTNRRHSTGIHSQNQNRSNIQDQGLVDENDNTTHSGVVKEHLHIKHDDDEEHIGKC